MEDRGLEQQLKIFQRQGSLFTIERAGGENSEPLLLGAARIAEQNGEQVRLRVWEAFADRFFENAIDLMKPVEVSIGSWRVEEAETPVLVMEGEGVRLTFDTALSKLPGADRKFMFWQDLMVEASESPHNADLFAGHGPLAAWMEPS